MKQKINQLRSAGFRQNWRLLVHNLVRPYKKVYDNSDLGDKSFVLNQRRYRREDHKVMHDNKTIQLSIFSNSLESKNIILYLHSNSSCKMQSTLLLYYLPDNFSLACFDFFGCGNNQMEKTLTLGLRQSQKTITVVKFLKNMKYRVSLWGRSMGAATALLCNSQQVQAIVADSSFLTFKKTFKQASMVYTPCALKPIFFCFFECIFYKLKKDVRNAANYDLDDLNIKKAVSKINLDTLLIVISGDKDQIVHHDNSRQIYNSFKGKNKHIQIFEGSHNSSRPEAVIQKLMILIQRKMNQKPRSSITQFSTQSSSKALIVE